MPWRHARSLAPFAARLAGAWAFGALGLTRRRPPAATRPSLTASELRGHWPGMREPGPSRLWRSVILAGVGLVLVAGGAVYAGWQLRLSEEARVRAVALTAGDPDLGRQLTLRYGCARCHTIPGVPGANGRVGPSLDRIAARVYIGGTATNSPDTLIQWIENPRSLDPTTAMPVTGISREEARHVAAYLYTLR